MRPSLLGPDGTTALMVAKVVAALLVPLAGSMAHAALYAVLALWALAGPRRAVEALTLCWLLTYINPGLYPVSGSSDMLRWLVVAAAFASAVFCTLLDRRIHLPTPFLCVVLFFLFAAGAALASYAPVVSLFKLVLFLVGVSTVVFVFHLARDDAAYFRTWFRVFFAVVLVLSFPLIIHDLGYVRNGRGFQGLLNHPQAYGVFLAPFLAWGMAALASGRGGSVGMWLLVAVGIVSLLATQARTAALAFVAALALVGLLALLRQPGLVVRGFERLFRPWALMTALLVVLALGLMFDRLTEGVTSFAFKSYDALDLGEAFEQSRGKVIEASLVNFWTNPWTGIGFGLASDPSNFNVQIDPFFGLPIGAPVEKGFALTAALEEVGLFGTMLVVGLVATMLWPTLLRRSAAPEMALAFGALLVNSGEAIIFSFGGTGLLVWLLLGYAWMAARAAGGPRHHGRDRLLTELPVHPSGPWRR